MATELYGNYEDGAKLLGVALAGGNSSRMGLDKAMLRPWGEKRETMLEHAIDILKAVAGQYVVSTSARRLYPGFACVPDPIAGAGPASGLLAGLRHARNYGCSDVLALACDLPNMRPGPLLRLKDSHLRRPKSALASVFCRMDTQKLEMLAAFYNIDLLPDLEKKLETGQRSIFHITDRARINVLPLPEQWVHMFFNCNTSGDLASLRQSDAGRFQKDGINKGETFS